MKRLLTLALFLALAATAQAHYTVPLPPQGWSVRYDAAVASGISPGGADVEHATIVMARPLQPYTFAHEVGHVFDWQALTDDDRRFFAAIMGVPYPDWWGSGGGAEAFADYYAANATGRTDIDIYVQIAPKRLIRFSLALLGVAARDGLKRGHPTLR